MTKQEMYLWAHFNQIAKTKINVDTDLDNEHNLKIFLTRLRRYANDLHRIENFQ